MDALRLDGNAAGGLLGELFGVDVTTAVGTCAGCGASDPVGAVHVYRAAGLVLRCPHCDAVLARIVEAEERCWIDLTGLRALEMRR